MMRSLSIFRRSSQTPPQGPEEIQTADYGRWNRKSPRRFSTRDVFRDFIRKPREQAANGEAVAGSAKTTPSTESIPSPTSPVNPNKPLPSRPLPGSIDKADGSVSTKPVLKLDRIMASLSDVEIEKLFSGAPQYFARSLGGLSGAPHPSVAFPWDEELGIRDLTDHVQLTDEAWGSVTLLPRLIQRDAMAIASPSHKRRPHFQPNCRERPNMLSMQGLEKGTMGYAAALEMAVSDALQEEQYGFDSLGVKSHVIVEQRQKMITSKDGLRHLDDAAIMEQLLKTEEIYQTDRSMQRLKSRSQELYNDLFTKVLHPPKRVIDPKDPYSLAVQINALVKVLATSNSWVDFSHVEWRIRLGQILWGLPMSDELEDGSSINEGLDDEARSEERYWLLLQLLLACELLVRLDAITEGDEFGGENLRASEVHRFEKEANTSVRWSLILARSWLENITITKAEAQPETPTGSKNWLTTLTSKISLKHEHMHGAHAVDHAQMRHAAHCGYIYAIQGRYTERQVNGLLHFAKKLRWPGIELYEAQYQELARTLSKATPINTPLPTTDSQRSSYFGGDRTSKEISRTPIRRRKVEAALHPSGWLSKTYVSGLVLPGETLSHFLMASLLESDAEAIDSLGTMSNLCGGFVYGGKSFWSTACIVGRVLAAGQGTSECMGWISSDIVPISVGESWFNVEAESIPGDLAQTGKKARIWGKLAIERESDVLGDADRSNVLPADFIIPHENVHAERPPTNIRIEYRTLNLSPAKSTALPTTTEDLQPTPLSEASKLSEIQTVPAFMTFSMTHDGTEEEKQYTLSLTKEIYFVTAHPCVTSSHVRFVKSPSSPTIQQIVVAGQESNGKQSNSTRMTGHPLHKYYTYASIHLTELLSKRDASLEELLSRGPSSGNKSPPAGNARPPRVLVIDCITGFAPPPSPTMGALSRMSSLSSSIGLDAPSPQMLSPPFPLPGERDRRPSTAASNQNTAAAPVNRAESFSKPEAKMRLGTRGRQFGSDLEMLVRAVCAEKGWNAIISRRRRGCLACAIREASAVGWKVIIRVD